MEVRLNGNVPSLKQSIISNNKQPQKTNIGEQFLKFSGDTKAQVKMSSCDEKIDLMQKRFVTTDGTEASEKAAKQNEADDKWWEDGGFYRVNYTNGHRTITRVSDGQIMGQKTVIKKDSSGRPIQSIEIDCDGDAYDVSCQYNDKNNKNKWTKRVSKSLDKNRNFQQEIDEIEYDDNGIKKKMTWELSFNDGRKLKFIFKFDDKGHLIPDESKSYEYKNGKWSEAKEEA